nr:MAG TPA: CobD/Cbib protein [Caudoviricetes sp.]
MSVINYAPPIWALLGGLVGSVIYKFLLLTF